MDKVEKLISTYNIYLTQFDNSLIIIMLFISWTPYPRQLPN
jgi:hypothetical protein